MRGAPRIGTVSHPLARLAAASTLAFFLLAQPGVVCIPLCLSMAHYRVAEAAAHTRSHAQPCHSENVIRSELPTSGSLGTMLPARWVPIMPATRIVAFVPAPPLGARPKPLSSHDPPPPRLI